MAARKKIEIIKDEIDLVRIGSLDCNDFEWRGFRLRWAEVHMREKIIVTGLWSATPLIQSGLARNRYRHSQFLKIKNKEKGLYKLCAILPT